MNGLSLLAPVPKEHIEAALAVLSTKEFVLFGSENFDVLKEVDPGAKTYIYISHDDRTVVEYTATFAGIVGELSEMRRLEQSGYRPATTLGEKWAFYWKVKGLEKLPHPLPLAEIQLPSGKYLRGVPHGPMFVAS
jgi:hypothetical protein